MWVQVKSDMCDVLAGGDSKFKRPIYPDAITTVTVIKTKKKSNIAVSCVSLVPFVCFFLFFFSDEQIQQQE